MPTSAGPNTLGESNLVFAYDTGDVSNSYRGEPTINLHPYSTDASNWTGNLFNNWINSSVTSNTLVAPDGTLTADILGNGYGRFNNSATITPGQIYTYSVYLKNINLTNDFGIFYSYGLNGNLVSYGQGISVLISSLSTTEWTRFTLTTTAPSSGVNQVQLGPCPFTGYGNPSGQQVAVWGGQIELKSHATPFVNGTRSATQGLLPLIGNSTIDLSNVSFDSSAKMVFDGTNDYVDCGAIQPFDLSARNVTWEAIVKFNDTSGVEAVVTRWDNTTGMIWWVGRYPTTKMHVAFIINGSYYDYYSDGDIGTTAGYHHIVATLNNTILSYYINGVLDSTDTVVTGTWTSDPDPSLIIGAQNQGAAANMNGEIPVVKIYNRALTAQEVKQNYQQYKTRFNLS